MTQQAQIARARARIVAEHIQLAGIGTIKATGARYFVVVGTHRQYFVTIEQHGLACTCPAHTVCKHRVLVHDVLLAERETKRRAARAAADARANRPFSLYK